MQSGTRPLPNLTALRLIAAAFVLAYHVTLPGALGTVHGMLAPFCLQGFLGVPLFFVLSGFVMAYSHEAVPSWKRFYAARFARIYPMYLLAFMLMLPMALRAPTTVGEPSRFFSSLLGVTLLQSWFPSQVLFGNPVGWTLSVEAAFYLVFPILLPFVIRNLQHTSWWIVGLWSAFLVPPLFANYPSLLVHLGLPVRLSGTCLHFSYLPVCFLGEFLMGIFAGAHFRRSPKQFGSFLACSVAMIAIASVYLCTYIGPQTARNSGVALIFLLLVYIFAGWKSPILASTPFQFGGEISYSVYLLQYWVIYLVQQLPMGSYRIPLMVVAVTALSSLAYVGIEKPARNAILRSLSVPSRPKPLPTLQVIE